MIPYRTKLILAFAAIYLVWGSTFIMVQHALKSFPPFVLSCLRLSIAGISLGLICLFTREGLPNNKEFIKNIFIGITIFVGGIVAVVWAQQYLSSSMTSVIITTPFWFVILDRRQWTYYFSSKWIISGLILGLIGVIVLMGLKEGRVSHASTQMKTIAILIIIIGSFLWAGGSLYLKYNPTHSSVYVNTSIQLISAGIVCIPLAYFNGDWNKINFNDVPWSAWGAVIYLAIASSLITFLAFIWLIKVQPPAIVSTYSYINPLVATLLGWGIAGEHISLFQVLALFIILVGVLFVNIPKYKTSKT